MSRQDELLDYPSAHRERAHELLLRRDLLSNALDHTPTAQTLLARLKWATSAGVIILTSLVVSAIASTVPVSLVLGTAALAMPILVIRAARALDRRERLEWSLEFTRHQLDLLRNDYTTPEGETWHSDLTAIDYLKSTPRKVSDTVILVVATIGIIAMVASLTWLAFDALVN